MSLKQKRRGRARRQRDRRKRQRAAARLCRVWPRCRCIVQGYEGRDCGRPMSEYDRVNNLLHG